MYVYLFSLGFLTATEHYNIYRSQIYLCVSIDICSFFFWRENSCAVCVNGLIKSITFCLVCINAASLNAKISIWVSLDI